MWLTQKSPVEVGGLPLAPTPCGYALGCDMIKSIDVRIMCESSRIIECFLLFLVFGSELHSSLGFL